MSESYICEVCSEVSQGHHYDKVLGVDGNEYNLVKCDHCKMIRIWPLPTEEFVHSYYSSSYQGQVKENITKWKDVFTANKSTIEDSYKKIEYFENIASPTRGKLLDVGCGYGFFVYAAKKSGYEAIGIDIDREAIQFAKDYLGIEVKETSIESLNTTFMKYDVISAWNVVEHVINLTSFMKQINELLNKGGIFTGTLPNIDGIGSKLFGKKWHLMVPPEHINYFNKRSLENLFIKNGFEPVFIGTISLYASPYFSFGVRRRIMAYYQTNSSKYVGLLLLRLNRILTLIKRYIIYYPLNKIIMTFKLDGDNIFFVVRKNKT